MTTSLERRQARGENVVAAGNAQEILALVGAGAGEIFQAVLGDQVLSSILVLASTRVAYYHSAGTTPEGMRAGASAFLIGAVAMELKSAGVAEFNLGGAEPENEGLYRFKSGFGCFVRELEQATFTVTDTALLKLQASLRSAVRDSRVLTSKLFGSRVSPSSTPDPADSSR
jgi:lipid II:glycine glycyltransferase (peptidoglycan interpeptide bridge formation enzyme)